MSRVRGLLLPAAVGLGVAAVPEYRTLPSSQWIPDVAVGLAALLLALLRWRSSKDVSNLALLVAATWWAGTLWPAALYWHRGAFAHLVLAVPRTSPRSRTGLAAVGCGYLAALATPLWQVQAAAVALAIGVVVAGIVEAGSHHRGSLRVPAALLLSLAIVVGAVVPDLIGSEAGPLVALIAYDALLIGVLLLVGLLARSPTRAELTDRAVDLGTAPVRDVQALTALIRAEPGLASDGDLQAALSQASRIEAGNQQVRDQLQAAIDEVDQSRQRLVVAATHERARLAGELAATAVEPLRALIDRAADAGVAAPALTRAAEGLDAALLGLRPPALARGLDAAIAEHPLASSLDVTLDISTTRCDEVVEESLYAVAAESLTNAAKHAGPCRIEVRFAVDGSRASLAVADDGVGGASLGESTGLAGLRDRLEALGGSLEVSSPRGAGTTVLAWVPLALTGTGRNHPMGVSRPTGS